MPSPPNNTNDNNNSQNNTSNKQQPKVVLPESIEKAIDNFLARVERHEFTADDGVSAQLQCSIEAVDLYIEAFNQLNDNPEEYWAYLVGINSRLQSAPALRILFSNLAKRVARYLVEGIRSCEETTTTTTTVTGNGASSTSNNNSMTSGNGGAGGGINNINNFQRAPTTSFTTSISMLQMDEFLDMNNNVNDSSEGAYSPQTAMGGGGQFPNMTRVPTAAMFNDDNDINNNFDGGNNNNGNNNNNNNGGNNQQSTGGLRAAGGGGLNLEDIALMTPAAAGHRVARQPKQHQRRPNKSSSAFQRIMSSDSNNNNNNNNTKNQGSAADKTNNNNNNNNVIKQRTFIQVVGAREAVEDALIGLKEDIKSVTSRMSKEAHHHIQNDEIVMAFGCTNTLTSFFKSASEKVRFRVLLIETANGSGASSLDSGNNMTVERICMTNCYSLMTRVSKVFLSTEAVFANGGLVAFSGSHAVCLAAKLCTVPVIVVVASLKFSDSFPSDSAGTTLIKVDQSRSVEWRDFLPPADILPSQFGSASDGFDCLYDTDSSSDEDSEGDHDEAGGGDHGNNSSSSIAFMSNNNMNTGSNPNNLSDTMMSYHNAVNNNNNNNNQQQAARYHDPNSTGHHQHHGSSLNQTISNLNNTHQQIPLYSPRTQRQAKRTMYRRHRPPVQVWNPLNEYVPPDCISIFVTELHEITPALVQVFVESLNEAKLNRY